ncbi:putative RNA-binding Zn ribbon-like protein [Actinoalloteichus hoggarensis]|uniref:CGNR zinc finger n=1 Tax=Actinoalloteichus hoggarensis TaxID=1470176 RepID=A0A221W424_9PSEU|nr:CGNR zinc finger domain-containing protein [Actinoalloteichus hoggarensis]ASO20397.1 CGNR zinc finger [Actinoalloteichus hoggarensis]MBB5923436.1 putative RNA-binding Zn ribbon-like protein [Actinoalloteichus hoggarensis]
MTYTRPPAPPPLTAIETFCNTACLLRDTDDLADHPTAQTWLRAHGHHDLADHLTDDDRHELVLVREAIRSHLADDHTADEARHVLTDRAASTLRPPRWTDHGTARLTIAARRPTTRLIGELLAALATEEIADRRTRLKACRAPDCRWIYYDRSPGDNSVWCSMNTCGARHKMRSYRSRRPNSAPPPQP